MSEEPPRPPALWTPEGVGFFWDYLARHQDHRGRQGADARALGFLAHCLAGFERSKAQLFQDLYVTYKLRNKTRGYFVEFGATDGVAFSNSWLLEMDLQWTGVLAEPLPAWHAALRANRRTRIDTRCVWRESGARLELLEVESRPELTSLKAYAESDYHAKDRPADGKTFMVETVSLTDLLAQHGAPSVFDYLSVDAEGAELDALEGLDFERFRPRVVTVEHNFREDQRNALAALLSSQGYVREFEEFSRFDDWYFDPGLV